ncbi:MAG TPA: aminotransferase class V-fold PLP-dependent enzyme [Thermoanaerobaculia bacterium]|nr:aminotransferase class V-fold PLP-dependent enzyme [Thermoanaerobaculia bacterium]
MTPAPAAISPVRIAELRREFPVSERYAYLNHAAIAPLPQRAVKRMAAVARETSRTGDQRWDERNEIVEQVRGLAARLVGARHTHEIAFVPNTSTGLSIVAQGLEWRAGDNVVGAMCEFPSNVYPWMALGAREVEYRQVPERDGRIDLDELLSRVDGRTRVLALSWVQYASGYRLDLEQLGRWCREQGVLFVVDAIQGLGALRLAVERDFVDVVAAGAHKWLLGPEGIGLLYVSDRVVNRIRPPLLGWRSMRRKFEWTTFDLTPAEGAPRHEPGTLNAYGIAALGESLHLLLELGAEAVERRVLTLAEQVASGLAERGFELSSPQWEGERSGIVAACHPEIAADELAERLLRAKVVVAQRAGRLRVSPHVYNDEEDLGRLFAALP